MVHYRLRKLFTTAAHERLDTLSSHFTATEFALLSARLAAEVTDESIADGGTAAIVV